MQGLGMKNLQQHDSLEAINKKVWKLNSIRKLV